ncbi:hypothetical protein V1477_003429 [Vespula maculifrons]|uniref:Uncharacterized protein n=1 Tax=Vespula maculifrons TaxID=7453 RepID=A0ABD2CTN9_VESMC
MKGKEGLKTLMIDTIDSFLLYMLVDKRNMFQVAFDQRNYSRNGDSTTSFILSKGLSNFKSQILY